MMMDFDGTLVASASVIELQEGMYIGPVTSIGADGGFTLELPFGEDLPEELFRTAEEFVVNMEDFADCTLTASDATVQVTATAFQLIFSLPGIALLTIDGIAPGLATPEFVDIEAPDFFLGDLKPQTWVYSEAPVTIQSVGAGCDTVGSTVSIDVALVAGWNQLEWSFDVDELDAISGINLNNSAAEEVFVLNLGSVI